MGENIKSSKRSGFSLVELMIVVVIVGILASMSLVSYRKAVRKAKLTEAKLALKLLWECNEMYYNEHGFFFGPAYDIGDTGVSEIAFSPLSGSPLFIYSIDVDSPFVYVAEPKDPSVGGDHSLAGYEIQLDHNGRLFIFEPGMTEVSGRSRFAPTGGVRVGG